METPPHLGLVVCSHLTSFHDLLRMKNQDKFQINIRCQLCELSNMLFRDLFLNNYELRYCLSSNDILRSFEGNQALVLD